jgi:hypothetical protein
MSDEPRDDAYAAALEALRRALAEHAPDAVHADPDALRALARTHWSATEISGVIIDDPIRDVEPSEALRARIAAFAADLRAADALPKIPITVSPSEITLTAWSGEPDPPSIGARNFPCDPRPVFDADAVRRCVRPDPLYGLRRTTHADPALASRVPYVLRLCMVATIADGHRTRRACRRPLRVRADGARRDFVDVRLLWLRRPRA